MSKTKSLFALGILVALSIAITGTYAWTSLKNEITSGLFGLDDGPGGSIHDDVDAPNKDIYVENWGTVPIFARMRLREYMEAGENAGAHSGSKNVKKLVESSDLEDESTWQLHVQDADGDIFRDYWKWSTGGQKYYIPVPEASKTDGYVARDKETYDGSEPGVKQTQNATILSMAEWLDLGRPIGCYWVGDTDGWYYWAAPLEPGDATGLLIDRIDKIKSSGGAYYYAIHASAQLATADSDILSPGDYSSFGKPENGGWTPEGAALMKLVTGNGDK